MKRKAFGRHLKNNSQRERDGLRKKKVSPVTSNSGESKKKKKIRTITANWGSKKSKAKETDERSAATHQPSYEVREIEIADIKIGKKRRSLNAEKLNDLMQSIPVLGFRQPITVWTVERRRDWKNAKREYLLVSGLHRLEATKQLGETKIPCFVMKGDERVARMWEISENLHRAELTPLEYDEQVAEWVKLLEADPGFSGQNVQKRDEAARRAASRKRRVSCQSRVERTRQGAKGWNVRLRSIACFRKRRTQ